MNNPTPPTPLEVQYPNGGVLGVQMYVYDTASASPILWTGGIAFTGSVTVGAITGTKSNNAATPGTTNFGVFPAICTTVTAGYTEGNLVALVVDTTGALKVAVTFPASVTVSGAVTVSGTVSVGNTVSVLVANTAGTAVPVTVQNTTVNAIVTGAVTVSGTVNATISNTAANPVAVTVQNTTVNAVITSIPAVNVTVSNTTFNAIVTSSVAVNVTVSNTSGAPVPVTVSNTTVNAVVTSMPAVNVTVSNTSVSAVITGVAYSNGSVSSTTQRVVIGNNTVKYTTAALTSSTAAVSTVANVLNAYMIYNPNASAAFVNLFDTTAVTLGTTAPAWVISIPATSAANLAQLGLAFSTALTINAATTFGGSTAPTTGLSVSLAGSVT